MDSGSSSEVLSQPLPSSSSPEGLTSPPPPPSIHSDDPEPEQLVRNRGGEPSTSDFPQEAPSKSKSDDPGSSSSSPSASKSKGDKDSDGEGGDEKMFECNICLDVAKEAVVSYCGHLFCWSCLHQWLETRPNRQSCPVCKAVISREKVIPLYGRGGSGQDPRSKVPPRPTPTRTEQPENNRFTWGGANDGTGGFHMSFGIGAFPFGFFASAFNWGQPGGPGMAQNFVNPQQLEDQELLSKVFLWVAIIFIVWLLLA